MESVENIVFKTRVVIILKNLCLIVAYNDKRVIPKSSGPSPLGLFRVYPGTMLLSLSALL